MGNPCAYETRFLFAKNMTPTSKDVTWGMNSNYIQ